MPEDRIEERHAIAEGQVTLFLMGHEKFAWQVWLDRQQDFDGLKIGYGAGREEAIEAAVDTLLEAVRALRALAANGAQAANSGGP